MKGKRGENRQGANGGFFLMDREYVHIIKELAQWGRNSEDRS